MTPKYILDMKSFGSKLMPQGYMRNLQKEHLATCNGICKGVAARQLKII